MWKRAISGSGGGGSETLLWTNPSAISAGFSQQNIAITDDLTMYNYIKITFATDNASNVEMEQIIPVDSNRYVIGDGDRGWIRAIQIVDAHTIFYPTSRNFNYSNTSDNQIVPYQIFGLNIVVS